MGAISRTKTTVTLEFADNGTLTTGGGYPASDAGLDDGILDLKGWAYGALKIPTGWVTADVCFMVAESRGGTFVMLRKTDGTAVKIDVDNVNMWYAIPAEVFMAHFVKLQSSDQTTPTSTVSQTSGPLTIQVTVGS